MKKLLARIAKREEFYKVAIARIRRAIEAGIVTDESEIIREWIEQYCIGKGADICTGDFMMGDNENTIGIDGDYFKLGGNYNIAGDELTPIVNGELDFIVTNYFDCFPNPLHTLQEWNRSIRKGGNLAFACCNAVKYGSPYGPLANRKRLSAFTVETIKFLLERAEFEVKTIKTEGNHILVHAVKK